jgi:hypothetical protein
MLIQHSEPTRKDGMRICSSSASVLVILPDWQTGKAGMSVCRRFHLTDRNFLPIDGSAQTALLSVVELLVGQVADCRGPPPERLPVANGAFLNPETECW